MLCSYIYYYFSKVPNGFRSVHIWDYRLIRLIYVLPKVAFCSRNVITLWFQALLMWNKSSFCSIDSTLCTRYIVSEIHPFLLHLFTILCSATWSSIFPFLTGVSASKTGASNKQFAVQEYFTIEFKEVEPTKKYKFLSIYVPCRKKQKLYAWLVFMWSRKWGYLEQLRKKRSFFYKV